MNMLPGTCQDFRPVFELALSSQLTRALQSLEQPLQNLDISPKSPSAPLLACKARVDNQIPFASLVLQVVCTSLQKLQPLVCHSALQASLPAYVARLCWAEE